MTTRPDCLFCRIIAGEIPAQKVHEDDRVVAFQDIQPQAPHHILICPKQHHATLNDLQETDEPLIGHAVRVAATLAGKLGVAEEGYRVVINCQRGAGQSVFHIHLHLLAGRPLTWPPG